MYDQLVVTLLGFATIFDTVLLVILFERVNTNQVAIWLRLLIFGVFAIHASSFLRSMQLQSDAFDANRLDRACYAVTAFGLLLLPSAMLHVAIRLNHTGPVVRPKIDYRYSLLYASFAVLPVVIWDAMYKQGTDLLNLFGNLLWPYMIWLLAANTAAIVLFLRVRGKFDRDSFKTYFILHSIMLCAMTLLAFAYVLYGHQTSLEPFFRLITVLSLTAPLLLFVWYSLKARLLSLVMERTIIYGAFLLAVFVFLRATFLPWLARWNANSDFDWLSIEILLAATVVLAWKPLRMRVLESLRYLFSNNVFRVRDATRGLSVRLTKLSSLPAPKLIEQFEVAVKQAMEVQSCHIAILEPKEWKRGESDNTSAVLTEIAQTMELEDRSYLARGWGMRSDLDASMERLDVMWAFQIRSGVIRGAVFLGPRLRCDRLADEQLTALSLLFEQFASTLENRWIDAQRIRAERMAMHQEKLSALGLMSSSLAHEIRNPLSSIRTITTVALEESLQNSPARQDLEMILSEIDRLSCTTQELLNFARPNEGVSDSNGMLDQSSMIHPNDVIENSLYVLKHLARQSNVGLSAILCTKTSPIPASRWMLSEVVFNLLRNAIEATQNSGIGQVAILTTIREPYFVIEVSDNGPGISAEVQKCMYHPFFTDKECGTGLGLYIVQERVKEMRGELQCESDVGHGTIFRVLLPRTTE